MNLAPWKRRDSVSADRLNQTTGAVNTNLPVAAGAGLLANYGSGGTIISQRKQQFFAASSGVSLVLAGTATLGGTYTANLLTPPTSAVNVTSAGTLTIAAIGVLSTTTVYAINALEEGSTGHALNPGSSPNIFPAIPTGGKSTDGKPIYIFIGEQFGGCGS